MKNHCDVRQMSWNAISLFCVANTTILMHEQKIQGEEILKHNLISLHCSDMTNFAQPDTHADSLTGTRQQCVNVNMNNITKL